MASARRRRIAVLAAVAVVAAAAVSIVAADGPTTADAGAAAAKGGGGDSVVTDAANVERYEFQAEVSRLMDIIIHSLYSNREVFLRELVSNANDALDKVRFQSLTNASALSSGGELEILVSADRARRTITLRDTGVGMTKAELVSNLGTIAKSGTSAFLDRLGNATATNPEANAANLIGQFGVGFYSSFLVAERVTVVSKSDDDDTQWKWSSVAGAHFSVQPDVDSERLGRGTAVTLHLRADAEHFMSDEVLERLIKRYSQFIVFPIKLRKSVAAAADAADAPKSDGADELDRPDGADADADADDAAKGSGGGEATKLEWQRMNEVRPLWTRDPAEVSRQQYVDFYKAISKSDDEPLTWIHFAAEGGEVDFRALLYIPKRPLQQMSAAAGKHRSTDEGEGGEVGRRQLVKLYVKRVLLSDAVEGGLLPGWLNFVVGVVDSDDLPINISREMLQQSKTLAAIKKKLLRKVLEAVRALSLQESDDDRQRRDEGDSSPPAMTQAYLPFWKMYGPTLKSGTISDSGNRERMVQLLRFKSSRTARDDDLDWRTMKQYVAAMKPDQDYIYYHSGEELRMVASSPFLEQLEDLNYEVLYLTDAVDEYFVQYYLDHEGIKLMSVAKDNFRLGTHDDEVVRAKAKLGRARIRALLKFLKTALGEDKVASVRTSMKLTRSPVAISSEQFGYSARMEMVLRAQALASPERHGDGAAEVAVPKEKIMEVNPYHPVVLGLARLLEREGEHSELARDLAHVMYDGALVASGFYPNDAAQHGRRMARLLARRVDVTLEREDTADSAASASSEKADGAAAAHDGDDRVAVEDA